MTEHHPAAFINALHEEGTKAEAIDWLQRTWNERCERAALVRDLLSALKEAVSFEAEDTTCLAYADESDGYEECPDARCKTEGCMVARVNRWRATIAKAERDD